MLIALPGLYPISFCASTAHWKPNGTNHGTKSNPTLVHLSVVVLGTSAANRGTPGPDNGDLRLWVYFRGGYAWHCDVHIDRADLPACPHCNRTLYPHTWKFWQRKAY